MLAYANDLSAIYSELDHAGPPARDSVGREYTLIGRVYRLLIRQRPEFEKIISQLCHGENPLSFEDAISQLLSEESRIQEMKGSSELCLCSYNFRRNSSRSQLKCLINKHQEASTQK